MSGSRVSGEELVNVLSASTWIGAASPKFSNLVLTQVFEIYAEYIRSHRFTITPENLIEDFGTRPSDVEPFIEIMGGQNRMPGFLVYLAGLVPRLPHPRNINIIVPLFVAFTVMTTFAVGLRMWSRHKVAGGIRSFDWLALAGFGMTLIYGAVSVYHSKISGTYQAYYDRTWDQMKQGYKVYLVLTIIYPFIMGIIKISLLLFYYRVATLNYIKWAVYGTGSLTIANTIAAIFTHCLQYRPIDYWNHFFEDPFKIQDIRIPLLVFGSVYIATDVAIWIIPMPMVFQLKLYPREKIIAVITFSLGAVACIASGFRLWSIEEFQNYSDKASSGLMIDAWSMIELNLTLICASAPAVRALAIHYAPKILSTLPSAFTTAGSSDKSKAGDSEKSVQVSQSPVVPKEVV